ncbi:hypothetical protein DPMN_058881 [Dreissena polymorpha]|uniref:Uncharacterized protein n=1 Tax=Dreissena polymorpha TaxID=45954 RepID=A0A9D4HEA4_DREPO|nr:hypothetical protein DPMN_058881 [Dreissena polymorpha]
MKAGSVPVASLQRPGRAPVYHNSAGTHRGYTGIRPSAELRQRPGLTPVVAGNSPAEPG